MNKIKKMALIITMSTIFSFSNISINSFAMEYNIKDNLKTNDSMLNNKRKKEKEINLQEEKDEDKVKEEKEKNGVNLKKEDKIQLQEEDESKLQEDKDKLKKEKEKKEKLPKRNNLVYDIFNEKELRDHKTFLELCKAPIEIKKIKKKNIFKIQEKEKNEVDLKKENKFQLQKENKFKLDKEDKDNLKEENEIKLKEKEAEEKEAEEKLVREKTIEIVEETLRKENDSREKKVFIYHDIWPNIFKSPLKLEELLTLYEIKDLSVIPYEFYEKFILKNYEYIKSDSCYKKDYVKATFKSVDPNLLKMYEMFNAVQALASSKFVKNNGLTITKTEFEKKKQELKDQIEKYGSFRNIERKSQSTEQKRKHQASKFLIKQLGEMNYDNLEDQNKIRLNIQEEQNNYIDDLLRYSLIKNQNCNLIPINLQDFKEQIYKYLLNIYSKKIKKLFGKKLTQEISDDIDDLFRTLKHYTKDRHWDEGKEQKSPLEGLYGNGRYKIAKTVNFKNTNEEYKNCLKKLIDKNSNNSDLKLDFKKMLERMEIIEAIVDHCLHLANSINLLFVIPVMQKVFGNDYYKYFDDGVSSDKEFNDIIIEKLKEYKKLKELKKTNEKLLTKKQEETNKK